MPIPLSVQLFDSFKGTQEGIHSVILPDIFSTGGSKNLFMDKYARAKKISGYTKQNSSAVTTDTGGSATLVRALVPYRSTGGGSTTRQLMGMFDDGTDEYELHYSTDNGATWTFIYDFGSTPVGIVPDFAQFGDTLYVTTGKVAPQKWDGSTLSAAGRTQSPTITSAVGDVGILSGVFKWKLVSMIGGARQAGSAPSTALALQDDKADLSWTADANTNVTGYELYRTTGTGDVYYFVDYIDLRATTSYTDNTSDLSILENRVLAETGDPPPTCYYCEPHKQRMWWGRTDTNPTRAYWSDSGLPEDVLSTNFLDFSDSETIGDVLTGMLGNFEGKLVVFTERAIWTVSGTGQVIGNIVDWTRIRTNAQVGSVSHKTAIKIPAGAKYFDQEGKLQATNVVTIVYLTPLNDIRLFDGDNDVIVSNAVKETLSTLNYSQRAKCFAITDGARGEISWIYPDANSGEPDKAVVWNYRWGVWYTREWGFSSGVELEASNDASLLVAGSNSLTTGGITYLLWSGDSFDGSPIETIWMTKALYGTNENAQPAITHQKRYRWIDLLFETEGPVTLTIEWLAGTAPDNGGSSGSTTASPAGQTVVSADGSTVLTADGSSITVTQSSISTFIKLLDDSGKFYHDTGIRLRISDNASNGSWSVEAFNLAYQLLPGLQRRMQ